MPEPTAGPPADGAGRERFHTALLQDDPQALYDRAPCGYLSTTPDGTITKVNETFLTWMGYEASDLVGRRTFAQLLSGGGRIYHETHYAPMLRMAGTAHGVALDLVRSDGTRLPALVNSVMEVDADGEPVVVRTAVFDASDRRKYEHELMRAKERAEASEAVARRVARTLQRTLVPPALPQVRGLDLGAEYRPAGRGDLVGGDFYDMFVTADGDWIVVLGDVCGKGADAAVISALARHTIRAAAVGEATPVGMARILNQVLFTHEDDTFCTILVVRLHRTGDGWEATVCGGGHPPPLLVSAGRPATPVPLVGTLIGAFADPRLEDVSVTLGPGDLLLLYTDGVPEGRADGEFFGDVRLQALVDAERGSASDLAASVVHEVVEFQGGLARDDIAVLAIRAVAPS